MTDTSGPTREAMNAATALMRDLADRAGMGDPFSIDAGLIEEWKRDWAKSIDAHTKVLRDRLRLAVEAVELAKRSVRTLDCGHHHCRYCDASSPEWKHAEACSYVRSEKDVRAFQEKADELRASGVEI